MDKKDKILELSSLLREYQKAYYIDGKPLVSDREYDKLFDELVEMERENPEYVFKDSPTKRVGSDLTSDFPEINHTIPVLSLDKAYFSEEVNNWMMKTSEKEKQKLSFILEEKIDGISIVLYYEKGILERAVTRGNGFVGNDVTNNVKTIYQVPLKLTKEIDIAVRGEIFISKSDFKKITEKQKDLEKQFANARNLAAGTIRRQKSNEVANVPMQIFVYEGFWKNEEETPKDHIHILNELAKLGFKTNPHLYLFSSEKQDLANIDIPVTISSFDELPDTLSEISEIRPSLEYEIDGMVMKVNELDVREKLGYTEHHPRWAIAYKFESPKSETVVNSVTIQVGRTGRITPVAELEAVSLSGSTIRRATLHNQEYIDELELAIKDRVSISKRGDVIPQVEEVVEKNEEGNKTYKIPNTCPSCGKELVNKGIHLFCTNYECPSQIEGRLSFFVGRNQMDIETLGPKTIELLIKKGLIKDIGDLYTTDFDQLEGTEGVGERTIELIKLGLEESKTRPFKLVLASLGLPDLGKKAADLLINNGFDSIDKLLAVAHEAEAIRAKYMLNNYDEVIEIIANYKKQSQKKKDAESIEIKARNKEIFKEGKNIFTLISINQFGPKKANNLLESLNDNHLEEQIEILRENGLQLSKQEEIQKESEEQIFLGQSWCITGSFENFNPRSKAAEEIEKRGGRTVSSVTGKTTHLLCGENAGSKKAQAEQLGVTIITEVIFLELISKKSEKKEQNGQLSLF